MVAPAAAETVYGCARRTSARRDNDAVSGGAAHEFFAASAGVAGALIGLLFVALSVAPERVLGPEASEVHSVRAAAALTAFTNALTVALFGLVPGLHVGVPATVVAVVGLIFIFSALLRLLPRARTAELKLRELSFLIGLFVVFVVQLIAGVTLDGNEHDGGALQTICILVIVCFLIGIERAWELVGGPDVGLWGSFSSARRSQKELADAEKPK
jgi:hypothetical protein